MWKSICILISGYSFLKNLIFPHLLREPVPVSAFANYDCKSFINHWVTHYCCSNGFCSLFVLKRHTYNLWTLFLLFSIDLWQEWYICLSKNIFYWLSVSVELNIVLLIVGSVWRLSSILFFLIFFLFTCFLSYSFTLFSVLSFFLKLSVRKVDLVQF